ncbi:Helix-turn-helix domain-containing protein [Prauserella aidingensis]|uniref:helix-turn-helix domain-containing protein n=1 Tax=Prauserella aidingensis TaxID=387890 RepID=UPI0020A40049|nr:helix-turn-helix transcriptional regulator [Prauserella aidingensis]MCP2254272.1 Helix-turn-helix domain-containing protein [Prauserella aidingensis]
MTDTSPRRLALGDTLRLLRGSAGLSGKQLAEQLGWQASKISKIENARQSVTDTDLVDLGLALDLDDAQVEELRNELRAIRIEEARWSQQLRVGHRQLQQNVAQADHAASHISVFSLALVPGLLQTAEYARHVFASLAELHDSPRDTDAAVRARMDRQQVLYDDSKQIELLMAESVLRHPAAPTTVMLGQIDRLITVQGLPSLRFGIIPFDSPLPAAVAHNFVMKDDTVTVELINTEFTTQDADDVALYRRYFDQLWGVAAEGEAARAILTRVASELPSG